MTRRSRAGLTGGSWYGSYDVIRHDIAEDRIIRFHSTNKSRDIKWAKEQIKLGKAKWVEIKDSNSGEVVFRIDAKHESLRRYLQCIVEDMRGVPDHVLREATRKFVDEIKQHVKRHVLMTSDSTDVENDSFAAMNDVMKELETEINELLDEKLWAFKQRT